VAVAREVEHQVEVQDRPPHRVGGALGA
jgi:hypothetical protein